MEQQWVCIPFDNAEDAAGFINRLNNGIFVDKPAGVRMLSDKEIKNARDTEYNGWTNYETWLVSLWLDNDEWSQEAVRDFITEQGKDHDWGHSLSHDLREWVENNVIWPSDITDEIPANLAADMLGAALGEVDWESIVEHHHAEIEWDEKEDDDDE